MVTKLFRLLMVQIMIQLTMANALEGRISHYVNLLNPSSIDANAKRLTCPVFSIKLANETAKFTKYIASESQFNMINWTERDAISTFKECAEKATDEKDTMFMWVDDVCSTSKILFTRQAEPCNEDTSTLVYMVEPAESWCSGEFLIYPEGTTFVGSMCGNPANSLLRCYDGKLYGEKEFDMFYHDGTGCFMIKYMLDASHPSQITLCGSKSTCTPKDLGERPAYLQQLREIAVKFDELFEGSVTVRFMVALSYDNTNSWTWETSGVSQPTNEAGEWKSGFPTTVIGDKTAAYMTHEGLLNDAITSFTDYVCCYEENSDPAVY